jgi:hypothetical protein
MVVVMVVVMVAKKHCLALVAMLALHPLLPRGFHIKDRASQCWESATVQRKHSLDWDRIGETWQSNNEVKGDAREIVLRLLRGE